MKGIESKMDRAVNYNSFIDFLKVDRPLVYSSYTDNKFFRPSKIKAILMRAAVESPKPVTLPSLDNLYKVLDDETVTLIKKRLERD